MEFSKEELKEIVISSYDLLVKLRLQIPKSGFGTKLACTLHCVRL